MFYKHTVDKAIAALQKVANDLEEINKEAVVRAQHFQEEAEKALENADKERLEIDRAHRIRARIVELLI